jgi:hypothetical protein
MSASHRVLLALLGMATAIGILGDQLLRPAPWGVGFSIWIAIAIGAALLFLVWTRASRPRTVLVLFGVAFGFAACLAWRDATRLTGWNVLATGVALTLALLHTRGLALWSARALDYASAVLNAGLSVMLGPVILLGRELFTSRASEPRTTKVLRRASLGLLLALPIVLVFGALLVSADPLFERLVSRLFDWDFERIVSHAFVIGVLSWLSAAFLRALVKADTDDPEITLPRTRLSLGFLEVGIPLGAVTLLFLIFVALQARWLFGGEDVIRATVGLTYAEYARRGFFELITVAGLVIPLLMACDWAIGDDDPETTRRFRMLAVTQLLLVGAILASAVARLSLYQDAYGLTETRLYAAVFMTWIALTLGWFSLSVLRGKRKRFVAGAAVAGFLVVAGLDVLDPDRTIVRTNVARVQAEKELDVSYLTSLSADAAPHLLAALPSLSDDDRCAVARHLVDASAERWGASWRSWNVGRARASGTADRARPIAVRCPSTATPAIGEETRGSVDP